MANSHVYFARVAQGRHRDDSRRQQHEVGVQDGRARACVSLGDDLDLRQ